MTRGGFMPGESIINCTTIRKNLKFAGIFNKAGAILLQMTFILKPAEKGYYFFKVHCKLVLVYIIVNSKMNFGRKAARARYFQTRIQTFPFSGYS